MVPSFQDFRLPFLQCLEDGKTHTLQELVDKISTILKLSEEDKLERIRNHQQTKVLNRTSWSKTYLQKAGLLKQVARGTYQITDDGLALLKENPDKIDLKLLNRYPSFLEFRRPKKKDESVVCEKEIEENETPEELFDATYVKLRSVLIQDLLDKVLAMNPFLFEKLVVELLVKMGYGGSVEDAGKATKKSGDEGIDGIIKEDKLGLDVIYIQAKRWQPTHTVGRPDLQAFVGAIAGQGGRKGIFITTSSFSKEAENYNPQNVKIVRIDGQKLAGLMIDYNMGVSTKTTYEIKKIDSDYFEE